MRDYTKGLAIVLTGSGVSKKANTETLLDSFIFGNLPADAQVDVKFIVPYTGNVNSGLTTAIDILKSWGITGKDFIPLVEPDCGDVTTTGSASIQHVDQGDALAKAIDLLSDYRDAGYDTVFISIFDPESTQDLDTIHDAKNVEWLTTLNLAEGLIDSFDGYESPEDRLKRETLQAAFEEAQAEKAAAEKPVAKKATTPRKRAAKKPVAVEDVPLVDAPEKALVEPQMDKGWGPHEHKYVWADDGIGHSGSFCACGEEEPKKPKPAAGLVADAVAREAEKKAARLELSGTIAVSSSLPKDLEPAKLVDPAPDVWKDVAAAVPDTTHITVAKEDLVKLNEGMQKMAEGFSDVLAAYNNMLENK